MLLALPWGGWAVLNLPIGSAGVHEWLPEGREERRVYDAFVAAFGNDQMIVASWDGCTVDDPRLKMFRRQLEQQREAAASESRFASIHSTDQLLDQLMQPPLRLSSIAAQTRLQGFMIGGDGTAAILVYATERGIQEQAQTVEDLFRAADDTAGLGRERLRLAGTIYECYAVDRAAEASLVKLVPPSSLLGLGVAWLCLQRLRYALCALLLAGIGQLFAVSLVYYSGNRFSAVLIVLPTLVFMLTLSGAVHLINYYRDGCRAGLAEPGLHALKVGWQPCLLSSLTTVIGMGSLWTSQLQPVRDFGLFSAVALTLATAALLLLFPTIMGWIDRRPPTALSPPPTASVSPRPPSNDAPLAQPAAVNPLSAKDGLGRYVDQLQVWASPLVIVSTVGLMACVIGLGHLKASTKFTDMFPAQSRVNQDMQWIETHLAPIATVEVLMNFSSDCRLSNFDRLRWIEALGAGLRRQPEVGGVMSVASLLPSWSEAGSLGASARRGAVRRAIDENLERFREEKWIADTDRGQSWRLIVKVSATSGQDYGRLVGIIEQRCQQVLDQGLQQTDAGLVQAEGIEVQYTGLTPIMHHTQITLLQDLGSSFLTAFLLITPILMLITRSWRGGLLAMIPNVLPVTVVFGVMGWFGYSLDIAGILTASVALGIAVDDTLHFLCWYMASLHREGARPPAIYATFKACAAAMLHTTLISCFSMAPFLLAGFLPTQQFAKLMIAILSLAIIGDLLILPALLLSPWGKVILPRSDGYREGLA
jgi:predicted RND superfamily exporter protein